jgi:hypothetical protein
MFVEGWHTDRLRRPIIEGDCEAGPVGAVVGFGDAVWGWAAGADVADAGRLWRCDGGGVAEGFGGLAQAVIGDEGGDGGFDVGDVIGGGRWPVSGGRRGS